MPSGFIVKMIPLLISATHNQVSLQTSMAGIKVLILLGIIHIFSGPVNAFIKVQKRAMNEAKRIYFIFFSS